MSEKIYEAVRTEIKSILPEKRQVDGQVIDTNRKDILQAVPYHVKMAIIKLQEQRVIPPRNITIDPSNKRSFTNMDSEEIFPYVKLPNNYSSLDEIKVAGVDQQPKWCKDEYSIVKKSKMYDRLLYKITKINIGEDNDYQDVLIMSSFDCGEIYLKYYLSGAEDNVGMIDETYWPAIVSRVKARVGLGSVQIAEKDAMEATENRRDENIVATVDRTKGSFFGRTSRKIRKRI